MLEQRLVPIPTLVGVNPGQNSRFRGMGEDLYELSPAFRRVIDRADAALGVLGMESLSPVRQSASVTFSIAAHEALAELLGGRTPGQFTALSTGENGYLVQKRMAELEPVIRSLEIRQEESEAVPRDGIIRTMFAAIGIDPALLRETLDRKRLELGERVEAVVSNINSPIDSVLSVRLSCSATEAIRAIKNLFPDIEIDLIPLGIRNTFHTEWMREAQDRWLARVGDLLNESTLNDPAQSERIYSPIAKDWIKSKIVALRAYRNQLTGDVDLVGAWKRILEGVVQGIVTFDPKDIMRPLVIKTVGEGIPVYNINDYSSLVTTAKVIDATFHN